MPKIHRPESTEKHLLKPLATTTDEAVDPLRDEGKRIVEGKPNDPRMLVFLFPRDSLSIFDPAGVAVNAPASKLLPK